MMKILKRTVITLFVLLSCASRGDVYEMDDGIFPETWDTGIITKGFTRISRPDVYSIKTPVAGNYPQGLYKYHYKTGLNWYDRELFTQTLEWFPPIHKTFETNTEYTARLRLDPVDSRRTFKGTPQNHVYGLPKENVKSITAKIIQESIVIYIVFNATESVKAAPIVLFEDNFSGTALDTTKWNTSPQWDRQRRSTWRPDMVEVSGGNLRIKYRRDTELGNALAQPSTNRRFTKEQNASSWIRTGGVRTIGTRYTERMFENSYGWYEARIKFPKTEGMWGAFWLMPMTLSSSGRGEIGSEIDIMESIGAAYNTYNHAIHWNYASGGTAVSTSKGFNTSNAGVPDIYDGQFHTFALDWSPGEYVFYINGIETWRVTPGIPEFNNIAIAQNPAYIKLTVEAADWDQMLPDGFTEGEMLVDYVRVYNQPRIEN